MRRRPAVGYGIVAPACRARRAASQPWRAIRETAWRTAGCRNPNEAISPTSAPSQSESGSPAAPMYQIAIEAEDQGSRPGPDRPPA